MKDLNEMLNRLTAEEVEALRQQALSELASWLNEEETVEESTAA